MTQRDRLIKLLDTNCGYADEVKADALADHLIENNVAVLPLTCDGCEYRGEYENEVRYGYPSPCTTCRRRVADNYHHKPEEVEHGN